MFTRTDADHGAECVAQCFNSVALPITFSRFTTDRGLLTKELSLKADGTIEKKAAVMLSAGEVEVVRVDTICAFAALLGGVATSQALSYGVPRRGAGPVMSEGRWRKAGCPSEVQQRCRSDFEWPATAGVWMLDFDPPSGGDPMSREALLDALVESDPAQFE